MQERERRGWKQKDLAARLDVSAQTLSKWENGRIMPRRSSARALVAAFNVPEEEVERFYSAASGGPQVPLQAPSVVAPPSPAQDQFSVPRKIGHAYAQYLKQQALVRDAGRKLDEVESLVEQMCVKHVTYLFEELGYITSLAGEDESPDRFRVRPSGMRRAPYHLLHVLLEDRTLHVWVAGPAVPAHVSLRDLEEDGTNVEFYRLHLPRSLYWPDSDEDGAEAGAPDLVAAPVPVGESMPIFFAGYKELLDQSRGDERRPRMVPIRVDSSGDKPRVFFGSLDVTATADHPPLM